MAGIVVENWRELNRLIAKADKETRAGIRAEYRTVAEPTRQTAEAYAQTRISRIGKDWWKMRTGVTQKLVYVAPRKRGVPRGDPAARPKFSPLMRVRVMDAALERHATEIPRDFEQMLDRIAARFNGA